MLIELIVAVSMAAVAITVVYFSWNFITVHTSKRTRYALLQSETNRIAHSIVSQIRRTPELIHWDEHQVVFIGPQNSDTIHYSYDGTGLVQNGRPLPIVTNGARIVEFKLRDSSEGTDDSKHLFLELSLVMVCDQSDTSRIILAVKTRKPADDSDALFRW